MQAKLFSFLYLILFIPFSLFSQEIDLTFISDHGEQHYGSGPHSDYEYSDGYISDILPHDNGFLITGRFEEYNGLPQLNITFADSTGSILPEKLDHLALDFRPISIHKSQNGELYLSGTSERSHLIRLTNNLHIDNSFNANLVVPGDTTINSIGFYDDGSLLIEQFDSYSGDYTSVIFKLNRDGSRSSGFSVLEQINGEIYDIEILDDQSALIAGDFTSVNGTQTGPLIKINAEGELSETFQNNLDLSESDAIYDITLAQSDSTLLIGGSFITIQGAEAGGFAKINRSGVLVEAYSGDTPSNYVLKQIEQFDNSSYLLRYEEKDNWWNHLTDKLFLTNIEAQDSSANTFPSDSTYIFHGPIHVLKDQHVLIQGDVYYDHNNRVIKNFSKINDLGNVDTEFNPTIGIEGNVTRVKYSQEYDRMLITGDIPFIDGNRTMNYALWDEDRRQISFTTRQDKNVMVLDIELDRMEYGYLLYQSDDYWVDNWVNTYYGFVRGNMTGRSHIKLDNDFPHLIYDNDQIQNAKIIPLDNSVILIGNESMGYNVLEPFLEQFFYNSMESNEIRLPNIETTPSVDNIFIDSTHNFYLQGSFEISEYPNRTRHDFIKVDSTWNHVEDFTYLADYGGKFDYLNNARHVHLRDSVLQFITRKMHDLDPGAKVFISDLNGDSLRTTYFDFSSIVAEDALIIDTIIQPNGKYLLLLDNSNADSGYYLTRFDIDGSIDNSFESVRFYGKPNTMTTTNDGVLVGGKFRRVNSTPVTSLVHLLISDMDSVSTTVDYPLGEEAYNPNSVELSQNYPNPFNPSTTITFALPQSSEATLRVFNIYGQVVETLIDNRSMNAGEHRVTFNAGDLASGVYLYQLIYENHIYSKKMTLIK